MICCKDSFFDGICLTSEFFSEEELLQFGQAVSDAGKERLFSFTTCVQN